MQKIITDLPFMKNKAIYKKAITLINEHEEGISNFFLIYPFLTPDQCENILYILLNNPNYVSNVYAILPFVQADALSLFVKQYIKGSYRFIDLQQIKPFIRENDLNKLNKHGYANYKK